MPEQMNLSAPPASHKTKHKSRHIAKLSNLRLLGRTTLLARVQQVASRQPNLPPLIAFLEVWKWVIPYLCDFIHQNAPYQTYPGGKTGIFSIPTPANKNELRIALAADWGTGTLEAETVATNMAKCSPDVTLHLGDVYYMGEAHEILENCMGKTTDQHSGVRWPVRGCHGSFALMGNHEMYSGGQGYFNDFLNHLGVFNRDGSIADPQSASYFCLETEHWIVMGLDTGYHSGGIPLLTSIPGVNSIPFLNVDARFDDKMLDWLRRTIDALTASGSARKPLLLLSHHQPISSFEHAFTKPAEQLAALAFFREREFVWLYGHEHRMTVYEKQTIVDSLTAYPRCVGHGGMPVSVSELKTPDPKVLYYDPRTHAIDEDDPTTKVGYNGHLELTFKGTELNIEYRDILNNTVLLTETFVPDGSGKLQFTHSTPPPNTLAPGH